MNLSNLGLWLIPIVYGVCFSGLAYVLLRAVKDALDSYAEEYTTDTARQFEDLFLFIPAQRLLEISRIGAIVIFVLFFLVSGDFGSAGGIVRGAVVGLIAGTLALFIPGILLRILRIRRLERFNEQLVDALTTMSNALRAGFSIIQAFESVVRERRNPISQEIGMFLQQLRVGVKFEEALKALEKRVGSEDLTLMLLAIETARQTGGNLTEVFDKIAVTIRERMRIRGRIKSLTAQGRLQGIVVGAMPALLFLVLYTLDPEMMRDFYTSGLGMMAIGLVIVLDILGFYVIRRIVNIDV
jgi:tight adherence protein B